MYLIKTELAAEKSINIFIKKLRSSNLTNDFQSLSYKIDGIFFAIKFIFFDLKHFKIKPFAMKRI
jgi:hypothetical protein